MTLRTRPLHLDFGLEVLDVDLAQLDQAAFDAIYALWRQDPLLLFRRQSLTEEELVAYSRGFGKLEVTARSDAHSPKTPEVIYVSPLKRSDGSAVGGRRPRERRTDLAYRSDIPGTPRNRLDLPWYRDAAGHRTDVVLQHGARLSGLARQFSPAGRSKPGAL
jgi:alpha-ketoglutarate-dependent taurine dioxygenase